MKHPGNDCAMRESTSGVGCWLMGPDLPSPTPNTHTAICLGRLDSVPLGEGRAFVAGELAIAVFRLRDDSLFACENRCPHQGGSLADGQLGADTVICPLHSRQFDLQTGDCRSDPNYRISKYPVWEVGGCLYVTVGSREVAGEGGR
jgi:nitrite reductase (NADH) small subunit